MSMKHRILSASLLMALASCTTNVQTNPARTATEELLISTAAERAAAKLALDIPENANVFVDNSNFEGTDSKYAIASIRTSLLTHNIRLVDDRKNADVIIETRAGALSTDRKSFLIGIPQFNIPIPLASGTLPFPEIALYGKDEQNGVAKFGVTGYDAKKGTLVSTQDPQYGFSHNIKKTVLLFISWTDSDYLPAGADTDKTTDEDPSKKSRPHIEINGNGYAPAVSAPAAAPAAPAAATLPSFR